MHDEHSMTEIADHLRVEPAATARAALRQSFRSRSRSCTVKEETPVGVTQVWNVEGEGS